VPTDPGCRLCGAKLHRSLLDLGDQPLANRTIAAGAPDAPTYPLHVRICDNCKLVQIADVAPPETVATPNAYLSSSSAARVQQAGRYAATMRKTLGLGPQSLVIEIGSNDGYLLRHFHLAGIPVLGIDPARNAAAAAERRGIPTEISKFNTGTAMEVAVRQGRADLLVANNVVSHAPDLFDFVAGCACLLRPNGVMTLQVPHLLSVLQKVQFDAFRHNTYVYLSLQVLERVLRSVGLRIFDAVREPDHGGSLRIHACHVIRPNPARPGLKSVRAAEVFAEQDKRDLYAGFSDRVAAACEDISGFLRNKRQRPPCRRLRGRRARECPAERLRRHHRSDQLRRRPGPRQARTLPARQPGADRPAGDSAARPAERHPGAALDQRARGRRPAALAAPARNATLDPGPAHDPAVACHVCFQTSAHLANNPSHQPRRLF
jgi:2-polyprenyl-3-methyl-5-hydroxy-6-metoxy-1,4-benzoquinol methylase